jgi:hypothetical protein
MGNASSHRDCQQALDHVEEIGRGLAIYPVEMPVLVRTYSGFEGRAKPPSDPSTAVRPPGSRDLLKTEQVMLPHLPIVGIMARRI